MTVLMIDLMLLLSYDYDVELYSSLVVALVTIVRDSVLFLSWLSKNKKDIPFHCILFDY